MTNYHRYINVDNRGASCRGVVRSTCSISVTDRTIAGCSVTCSARLMPLQSQSQKGSRLTLMLKSFMSDELMEVDLSELTLSREEEERRAKALQEQEQKKRQEEERIRRAEEAKRKKLQELKARRAAQQG